MDDAALKALLVAMIRAGTLPERVVDDAADELEQQDQDLSAHRLRCLLIEADSPRAAERKAEARRPRLEVLKGGADGGNGG